MIELPRHIHWDDERECQFPCWSQMTDGQGSAYAYMKDSNGHFLSLQKHRILDDGTVEPSVVCPIVGCGFHENIKLVGWNQ